MRARLYRGPHDGKVLTVPDNQRDIKLMRKRARQSPYVYLPADQPEFITIETIADEYRMVEVALPNYGGAISSRHVPSVHPDGSVYFEWTQKRGSRIER